MVCCGLWASLRLLITGLGCGSDGTRVFKGSFQQRAVAVKRLVKDCVTLDTREVDILSKTDVHHPNVIRYIYHEVRTHFLYIAIELCSASLAQVIERPNDFTNIAFDPKRALREITSGLRYLHALNIVHRDIKPQNIMVSRPENGQDHKMLISDFGLCRLLEGTHTSFMPTTMAAGTVGWRAPEILRRLVPDTSQSSPGSAATLNRSNTPPSGSKPMKLTRAVDIFALGCLYYYCLSRGHHPYGDEIQREHNIRKGIKGFEHLGPLSEENDEATDLIEGMLNPRASLRYVKEPFL